jgi:hypothetical protein
LPETLRKICEFSLVLFQLKLMVEANPFKFYLAKYFFLVFALLQWGIGAVLFYLDDLTIGNMVIVTFFIFLGVVLILIFNYVSEKIKRVAVGNNKFVILEENSIVRFGWPEVKSFKLIPFLNLCKVRIRGRKGAIYFFSAGNIRQGLDRLSGVSTKRKKN